MKKWPSPSINDAPSLQGFLFTMSLKSASYSFYSFQPCTISLRPIVSLIHFLYFTTSNLYQLISLTFFFVSFIYLIFNGYSHVTRFRIQKVLLILCFIDCWYVVFWPTNKLFLSLQLSFIICFNSNQFNSLFSQLWKMSFLGILHQKEKALFAKLKYSHGYF